MKTEFEQVGGASDSANALMDVIREGYIKTGTADALFAAIDAYGASLFHYNDGATHSWVGFVTELYEDTPTQLVQALEGMLEAGLQYNPAYRDAQGRNETMIIADNGGFGMLRKALEGGLKSDLSATDNAGRTTADYVSEYTGSRGLALAKEYNRYQQEQTTSTRISVAAGITVGAVVGVSTRHPSLGIIAAAAVGGGYSYLSDKVNGHVHARNVDVIINPAKYKGLQAEL